MEQIKEVIYAYEYLFLEDETQPFITVKYRFYLVLTAIPSFFYCILTMLYYRLRFREKEVSYNEKVERSEKTVGSVVSS